MNNNGDGSFIDSNLKIEWNDTNSHIVGFNDVDIDNDGDLDIVFIAMNLNGVGDEVFDELKNQINLQHLVEKNINNLYVKYKSELKIDIPNVKDIKWVKGVTVQDKFKFLAVQQADQLKGTFYLLEFYLNERFLISVLYFRNLSSSLIIFLYILLLYFLAFMLFCFMRCYIFNNFVN